MWTSVQAYTRAQKHAHPQCVKAVAATLQCVAHAQHLLILVRTLCRYHGSLQCTTGCTAITYELQPNEVAMLKYVLEVQDLQAGMQTLAAGHVTPSLQGAHSLLLSIVITVI